MACAQLVVAPLGLTGQAKKQALSVLSVAHPKDLLLVTLALALMRRHLAALFLMEALNDQARANWLVGLQVVPRGIQVQVVLVVQGLQVRVVDRANWLVRLQDRQVDRQVAVGLSKVPSLHNR